MRVRTIEVVGLVVVLALGAVFGALVLDWRNDRADQEALERGIARMNSDGDNIGAVLEDDGTLTIEFVTTIPPSDFGPIPAEDVEAAGLAYAEYHRLADLNNFPASNRMDPIEAYQYAMGLCGFTFQEEAHDRWFLSTAYAGLCP